jgi:selenocysteine-specific elongation factor
VQTLDRIVTEIPEREMGHIFRLPIDRVFTMKGFGTVVTGTTISGQIHLGDEATIYPQGLAAKIRGMQVHNREVDHVRVGLRTAINLQGVEKAEIDRGHILTGKDSLRPTQRLDVLVELLPSVPKKLKNRARVRFHTGTSEIISTIVLLDRDELIPGESCFAQIRLDDPTAVLLHDRYVLRSYSPVRTIGGGEILSPLPGKRKRFSGEALTELKVLSTGSLSDIAAQFVHSGRFQGVELGELLFLTCAGKKELNDVLKALQAQKKIIQYDKERQVFIHAHLMERAREEIMTTLSHFHRDFPLKEGLSKEEVRSRTAGSNNPKLFHFIINQLIQEDLIAQEKDLLRLKEHRVTLGQDQEDIRRELGEIYLYQGLQPPYFRDIKDKFPGKAGSDVLEVMVKDGVLIKVKEDLYFHGGAIDELRNRLIQFLKEKGEISTTQFKDLTGVSRKYAIPLVEYFDKCQLTVRVGDNRVLRKK